MIIFILIAFIFNSIGPMPVYAEDFFLPKPGVMVHLSPAFNPPILRGIKVDSNNPFRFDFVLDQGDVLSSPNASIGDPDQEQLKQESTKLIKYFLASLTVPEKDLWVNLSPYEKDRIVPESFGQTEMGRDLLAQDYILKQITASLIYPEDEIGKKFWKRIYEEAAKKYGSTNIPVNTFNKVWIVPEKAVVYENAKAGTAYVVESKLKVMLEHDYLAKQKHSGVLPLTNGNDTSSIGVNIVREIVIPELTKEINEGKNFAQLRQVYNSLILATWYKKKIKDSILAKVYADKNKVTGLSSPNVLIGDPGRADVEKIYQQYLKAFQKGAYNYIKEEIDPITQQTIPRKYFSGGFTAAMITPIISYAQTSSVTNRLDHAQVVTVDFAMADTTGTANGSGVGDVLKDKAYIISKITGSLKEVIQVSLQNIFNLESEGQAHRKEIEFAWNDVVKAVLILSYFKDKEVKTLVNMVLATQFPQLKAIALEALYNVDEDGASSIAREWLVESVNKMVLLERLKSRDMSNLGKSKPLMDFEAEAAEDVFMAVGNGVASFHGIPDSLFDVINNGALIEASVNVLINKKDQIVVPTICKYLLSQHLSEVDEGSRWARQFGFHKDLVQAARSSLEVLDHNFKQVGEGGADDPENWKGRNLLRVRDSQIELAWVLAKMGDREYAISRLKYWFEFHIKFEEKWRKVFNVPHLRYPVVRAAEALIDSGEAAYVMPILEAHYQKIKHIAERGVVDTHSGRSIETLGDGMLGDMIKLLFKTKSDNAIALFNSEWTRIKTEEGQHNYPYLWRALLSLAQEIQYDEAIDFLKKDWDHNSGLYFQREKRKVLIGLGYPRAVHSAIGVLKAPLASDNQREDIYIRFELAEVLINKLKLGDNVKFALELDAAMASALIEGIFNAPGWGGIPNHDISKEVIMSAVSLLRARRVEVPKGGVGLVVGFGNNPQQLDFVKKTFKLERVIGVEAVEGEERRVSKARKSFKSRDDVEIHQADMNDMRGVIKDKGKVKLIVGTNLTAGSEVLQLTFAEEIVRVLEVGGVAIITGGVSGDFIRYLERYGDVLMGSGNDEIFVKRNDVLEDIAQKSQAMVTGIKSQMRRLNVDLELPEEIVPTFSWKKQLDGDDSYEIEFYHSTGDEIGKRDGEAIYDFFVRPSKVSDFDQKYYKGYMKIGFKDGKLVAFEDPYVLISPKRLRDLPWLPHEINEKLNNITTATETRVGEVELLTDNDVALSANGFRKLIRRAQQMAEEFADQYLKDAKAKDYVGKGKIINVNGRNFKLLTKITGNRPVFSLSKDEFNELARLKGYELLDQKIVKQNVDLPFVDEEDIVFSWSGFSEIISGGVRLNEFIKEFALDAQNDLLGVREIQAGVNNFKLYRKRIKGKGDIVYTQKREDFIGLVKQMGWEFKANGSVERNAKLDKVGGKDVIFSKDGFDRFVYNGQRFYPSFAAEYGDFFENVKDYPNETRSINIKGKVFRLKRKWSGTRIVYTINQQLFKEIALSYGCHIRMNAGLWSNDDREGLSIIKEMIIQGSSRFEELAKELEGKSIGLANGAGDYSITEDGYRYVFSGPGVKEAGWFGKVIKCIVHPGILEFRVEYSKDGEKSRFKTYQITGDRKSVEHSTNANAPNKEFFDINDRPGIKVIKQLMLNQAVTFPNVEGLLIGSISSQGKVTFTVDGYTEYLSIGKYDDGWTAKIVAFQRINDRYEILLEFNKDNTEPYQEVFWIGPEMKEIKTKNGSVLVNEFKRAPEQRVTLILDTSIRSLGTRWAVPSQRLSKDELIREIERRLDRLNKVRLFNLLYKKSGVAFNEELVMMNLRYLRGSIFDLLRTQAGIEFPVPYRIKRFERGELILGNRELDYYLKHIEDAYIDDGRLSREEIRRYFNYVFDFNKFRLSREELLKQCNDLIVEGKSGEVLRLLRHQVFLNIFPGVSKRILAGIESRGHRIKMDDFNVIFKALREAYDKDGRLSSEEIMNLMRSAFSRSFLYAEMRDKHRLEVIRRREDRYRMKEEYLLEVMRRKEEREKSRREKLLTKLEAREQRMQATKDRKKAKEIEKIKNRRPFLEASDLLRKGLRAQDDIVDEKQAQEYHKQGRIEELYSGLLYLIEQEISSLGSLYVDLKFNESFSSGVIILREALLSYSQERDGSLFKYLRGQIKVGLPDFFKEDERRISAVSLNVPTFDDGDEEKIDRLVASSSVEKAESFEDLMSRFSLVEKIVDDESIALNGTVMDLKQKKAMASDFVNTSQFKYSLNVLRQKNIDFGVFLSGQWGRLAFTREDDPIEAVIVVNDINSLNVLVNGLDGILGGEILRNNGDIKWRFNYQGKIGFINIISVSNIKNGNGWPLIEIFANAVIVEEGRAGFIENIGRLLFEHLGDEATEYIIDYYDEFLQEQRGVLTGIKSDQAMNVSMSDTGGVDLTSDQALQVKSDGLGVIKFNIDPAIFAQLQNAPGFVPVIINIQPLKDLHQFLGITS